MLNKLYAWLENKDEYHDLAKTPSTQAIEKLLEKHSLSSYLPYEAYDPMRQIYYNGNDTMGIIFYCTPLVGSDDKVQKTLSYLFCNLPDDAVVTVTTYASPKIGDVLDQYVASRVKSGASKLHREIAKNFADLMRAGAHKSVTDKEEIFVRYYQIFFSINLPAAGESSVEKLVNLKATVTSTLNSIGIWNEAVSPKLLIRFLRELAEAEETVESEDIYYDADVSIARQACSANLNIVVDKNNLQINNREVRVLYAEHYPLQASQGTFLELIGGLLSQKGSKIPCPFLLTFVFSLPQQSELLLATKASQWNKKANNSWRNYIPLIDEINQDWKDTQRKLKRSDKIAESIFLVTLYMPRDKAEGIEKQVVSHFNYHQWKLKRTGSLSFPSWLANFPLFASNKYLMDARRFGLTKTCLASNAASLAPFQGEWLGNKRPFLPVVGVNGQLINVNFFDTLTDLSSNANIAVSGASGSGKSVLQGQIEQATHALGGQVWVFDEGNSHQKVCELHDGIFLDLATSKNLIINPFTYADNIHDKESSDLDNANTMSLFKSMIIQMAFRKAEACDAEEGLIEEAIRETWNQNGQNNSISEVQSYLHSKAKTEILAKNIALSLYPYSKDGMFGRFFNGKANLDFNNSFMVFEMAGLKSQPGLKAVLLMLSMHRITQYINKQDRSSMKLVSADESWQYFSNSAAACFFDCTARTIRKHGGILMMSSQSINDWYQNAAGVAIFENSRYKLSLHMNAETIVNLRKNDRVHMDDFKMQVLQNLETKNGLYSDIMLDGPHGYSVVRSLMDPFQKVLFSTTPHVYQRVVMYREQGMDLIDALYRVQQEMGELL